MSSCWGDVAEGVRVEVPNTDSNLPTKVYWIAGIVKLAGITKCNKLRIMLLSVGCRAAAEATVTNH